MHDPQSFDRFALGYDFLATLTRNHSFFLERLPERRHCALDVGCGSGGLVEALAPHFAHVHGVDISEPLLEIARDRRALPNVSYGYGDANTFEGVEPANAGEQTGEHPGRDRDGYDLIVSHTMFHHLPDAADTLKRLSDLLAPGGRLLVVDNVSWTDALPRIIFLIGPWQQLPRWVRRFGLSDAMRLLRFSLSKPWVDHLVSDRYLTESGFGQTYGDVLPGAVFTRMSVFMGLDWKREPDAG